MTEVKTADAPAPGPQDGHLEPSAAAIVGAPPGFTEDGASGMRRLKKNKMAEPARVFCSALQDFEFLSESGGGIEAFFSLSSLPFSFFFLHRCRRAIANGEKEP
jgi:hypothetical protein